jgi:hypothetical protein
MMTTSQNRLWRVEWIHINGYQAPYQVVEAKTYEDAHAGAKANAGRLGQFPNTWSFRLKKLPLVRTGKSSRWHTPKAAARA